MKKLIRTTAYFSDWTVTGLFFLSFILDTYFCFLTSGTMFEKCAGLVGLLIASFSINILLLNAVPMIMRYGFNRITRHLNILLFISTIGTGVIAVSVLLGLKFLILFLISSIIFAISVIANVLINWMNNKVFFEEMEKSGQNYISLS